MRNDNMIYYQFNLVFAINLLANAAWLPIFNTNTEWGLIVGFVLMLILLVTNLSMMSISGYNEVWWLEVLIIRIPFSLYAGWITTATILGLCFLLKSWGMYETGPAFQPDNDIGWDFLSDLMFMGEEEWSIVLVWGAFFVYEIISWVERNPVYGGVYVWALAAILDSCLETRAEQSQALVINIGIAMGMHGISMVILALYLLFEVMEPWYEPLSFWGGGILGFTDWSLIFT